MSEVSEFWFVHHEGRGCEYPTSVYWQEHIWCAFLRVKIPSLHSGYLQSISPLTSASPPGPRSATMVSFLTPKPQKTHLNPQISLPSNPISALTIASPIVWDPSAIQPKYKKYSYCGSYNGQMVLVCLKAFSQMLKALRNWLWKPRIQYPWPGKSLRTTMCRDPGDARLLQPSATRPSWTGKVMSCQKVNCTLCKCCSLLSC